MTPEQSKLLNGLGLIAIDTVLVLAFVDQLWFRDLPCPLCILQRVGFIAAGFGIALNLLFGPKPSHYGITILGACAGAIISVRQILLHIVPGSGEYGNAIFGLHLYSWALMFFGLMVIGTGIMLFFERQFAPETKIQQPSLLSVVALATFFLLAAGNVISTLSICGVGLCPDNPSGYLIFNDNLSITSLGNPA
ncbi:MAG TPA: disulfide bond formation protein B [Methyloceanibacter sp.]|jgi:disulfide bond formation protein DsbB|nr:disulfide bond formation protein B [Methyloceanibacter sp.]